MANMSLKAIRERWEAENHAYHSDDFARVLAMAEALLEALGCAFPYLEEFQAHLDSDMEALVLTRNAFRLVNGK